MSKLSMLPCAIVTLMLLSSAAGAADGEGNFAVKGVGVTTCRDFLQARRTGGNEYLLYGGYVGGYISAYNQFQPQTFDVLPWHSVDTLARMLASFCEKSPQSLFAAVLSRLIKLIKEERIASSSPAVRAGGTRPIDGVMIYVEALRRTQEKLAQLGLYAGTPDGSFDDRTREALERFQLANGLPQTGLPDQVTLFVLYYPPKRDN
jgi:hypothetical protein